MNPFTIQHNASQLLQQLYGLHRKVADLSPFMQKAAQALADSSEQAFATESDPSTGESWQALSGGYLQSNPDRASGQMLQLSAGGLAPSLSTDHGDFWALISSNKPYAAIHQLGGTAGMAPGPAAIPARPYLGLTPENSEYLINQLKQLLQP